MEFEVEGKKFTELLSERTVSSTTRTFKLNQEWVDAGVKTNEVVALVTGIDVTTFTFEDRSFIRNITTEGILMIDHGFDNNLTTD